MKTGFCLFRHELQFFNVNDDFYVSSFSQPTATVKNPRLTKLTVFVSES